MIARYVGNVNTTSPHQLRQQVNLTVPNVFNKTMSAQQSGLLFSVIGKRVSVILPQKHPRNPALRKIGVGFPTFRGIAYVQPLGYD